MFENIVKEQDGIYIEDAQGNKRKIAKYMEIVQIKNNIETNEKKAIISYEDIIGTKTCEMNREEYLNPSNLILKQNIGLDVMRTNASQLSMHFRNEEENVSIENVHSGLGFDVYDGKEIYKLYECIGINSTYDGDKDIKPKGSRDEYLKMFNEHILGNPELELISAISLSAVLIGYIGEDISLDTLIVHLFGNSTTGKSTALKLAISMFGYPDVKKNGLFTTYNATENALLKQLEGLRGVPLAIDEVSMSKIRNFTELIYKIANGTDKARLNKNSENISRGKWLTTVMSNGEKSLISSSNKNAGIQVRVLEFDNIVWTKSAEHSEKINKCILENYGFLGYEFARLIMKYKKEQLIQDYDKLKASIKKIFKDKSIVDSFSDRRVNRISILMLSINMLEKLLNVEFNVVAIINILIDVEKKSISSRNFDGVFIDFLYSYISENKSKFSQNDNIDTINNYIGNVKDKGKYLEVEILPSKFENIVKEAGFESKEVVLKELKKSNILNSESDRYTRKRKTQAGITTSMYVIKLNKNDDKVLIDSK